MTRGICYVAWGEKHIHEAILSARHNGSGYPTCLITDNLDPSLGQHFDHLVTTDIAKYDAIEPNPQTFHGFWRKMAAMMESPFDVTCFVDTDCHVVGNIDLAFELAEEGNFCTSIAPSMTFKDPDGKEWILSNGGLYVSKTPNTELFGLVQRLAPTVGQWYWGDEGVISMITRMIKHTYLPWTFMVVACGQNVDIPIRVFHSRFLVGHPPKSISSDYFGNPVIKRH